MFDRKGCRKLICDHLALVDLGRLRPGKVGSSLDIWTRQLEAKSGSWGPSRKALNLFLRDAAYNFWLRKAHRLAEIECELELPLDGIVMTALANRVPSLPQPQAVKRLNPTLNAEFQRAANGLALIESTARIHLDLELWNGGLAGT